MLVSIADDLTVVKALKVAENKYEINFIIANGLDLLKIELNPKQLKQLIDELKNLKQLKIVEFSEGKNNKEGAKKLSPIPKALEENKK